MQKRLHAGCQAITEHDRHVLTERRQIRERLDRRGARAAGPKNRYQLKTKLPLRHPLAQEHEVGYLLEVLVG